MYGQFARGMNANTDTVNRWLWTKRSDLKIETEASICAAQEQALRINYMKCKFDSTTENAECVVRKRVADR